MSHEEMVDLVLKKTMRDIGTYLIREFVKEKTKQKYSNISVGGSNDKPITNYQSLRIEHG
jgi:hypothetical protein